MGDIAVDKKIRQKTPNYDPASFGVLKIKKRLSVGGVHSLGETRHLAGGGLPMDGALAGGLVQRGRSKRKHLLSFILFTSGDGSADALHNVTEAGLGGAVTSIADFALLVTLDGRLMVSHGFSSESI